MTLFELTSRNFYMIINTNPLEIMENLFLMRLNKSVIKSYTFERNKISSSSRNEISSFMRKT